MTSIHESMCGLNGDKWGTTFSKEEQLTHQTYVKNKVNANNSYEDERAKLEAQFKQEGGFEDRTTGLEKFRTGFIDFSKKSSEPNTSSESNTSTLVLRIAEIESKHTEDMKILQNIIDDLNKRVNEMNKTMIGLDYIVKELTKPSLFRRFLNYFKKSF